MATDTITVTVRGVELEVDFSYIPKSSDEPEELSIEEIRHNGTEIMCFFADDEIDSVRNAILEERGK